MIDTELITVIRNNLGFIDSSKDLIITDVMTEVKNHCNLSELPIDLEPFIRKKVKGILDYEKENGEGQVFDVKSIKEGDTSITYNVDENFSKETIYGLSNADKKALQAFRRLRK